MSEGGDVVRAGSEDDGGADTWQTSHGREMPPSLTDWHEWALGQERALRDAQQHRSTPSAPEAAPAASRVLPPMNTNGNEYQWLSPRAQAANLPPAPLLPAPLLVPVPPPASAPDSPRYRRPVLAMSERVALLAREEQHQPRTPRRYEMALA